VDSLKKQLTQHPSLTTVHQLKLLHRRFSETPRSITHHQQFNPATDSISDPLCIGDKRSVPGPDGATG
jgi:hypothetical protein